MTSPQIMNPTDKRPRLVALPIRRQSVPQEHLHALKKLLEAHAELSELIEQLSGAVLQDLARGAAIEPGELRVEIVSYQEGSQRIQRLAFTPWRRTQ